MADFANKFYGSPKWKKCRESFKKYKRYLCEDCLDKGILATGEIVHHIIPLTPENINDPNITMNFDNLKLVCRKCHAEEHTQRNRRFVIDDDGRVYPKTR